MTYERDSNATRHSRPRRLWSLVAALWVAVGLSPCALAAVGDLDCLHCPDEAGASGHAMHAAHGDPADNKHDASGHGDAAGDCGDDCLDAGESLVDARNFKSSTKDADDNFSVAVGAWQAITLACEAATGGVDPPAVSPVPSARLHAIHCVYLD